MKGRGKKSSRPQRAAVLRVLPTSAPSSAPTSAPSSSSTPPPPTETQPPPSSSTSLAIRPAKPPKVPPQPFRLLDLPAELRLRIYTYHFSSSCPAVLDLDPDNQTRVRPLLNLLRTCRLIHAEASYHFWSTHPVRVFPTHPGGRFFKTTRPLLARMKPRQRTCLTALELRVGPGWGRPPKGWVVSGKLGLRDCARVRRLCVFVECDPSDGVFTGFRRGGGFYEKFCADLLVQILDGVPTVHVVEFDAWSSVKKSGAMMRTLLAAVRARPGLAVRWGPERGWSDAPAEEVDDTTALPDPQMDAELQRKLAALEARILGPQGQDLLMMA